MKQWKKGITSGIFEIRNNFIGFFHTFVEFSLLKSIFSLLTFAHFYIEHIIKMHYNLNRKFQFSICFIGCCEMQSDPVEMNSFWKPKAFLFLTIIIGIKNDKNNNNKRIELKTVLARNESACTSFALFGRYFQIRFHNLSLWVFFATWDDKKLMLFFMLSFNTRSGIEFRFVWLQIWKELTNKW